MKTFTIENGTNNITLHATTEDAEAVANAGHFRTEAQLAKLAADWPMMKLIEIWNSLPGVSPVNKFKDRATAVGRIWKAIQGLGSKVKPETAQQPEVTEVIATTPEDEDNSETIDIAEKFETMTVLYRVPACISGTASSSVSPPANTSEYNALRTACEETHIDSQLARLQFERHQRGHRKDTETRVWIM
jgi:hypothetical protein